MHASVITLVCCMCQQQQSLRWQSQLLHVSQQKRTGLDKDSPLNDLLLNVGPPQGAQQPVHPAPYVAQAKAVRQPDPVPHVARAKVAAQPERLATHVAPAKAARQSECPAPHIAQA